MLADLTVVFLTVNKVPKDWAAYHREVLLRAADGFPMVTVSREPVDIPGINIIQDGEISAPNIYRQMLRAARVVETPFLAIAEDDSLYPREHFTAFRPQPDEIGYNMHRWAVFTWGTPIYFFRERISNLTMVAPTELALRALEERFERFPDGLPPDRTGELGKNRIERRLGVTENKLAMFYSDVAVVNLNHVYAIDKLEVQRRKKMSCIQALEIPYWGRAEDVVGRFV
jgi:hypothetical protein